MDTSDSHIFDEAMEPYGRRLDRGAIGPSLTRLFDLQRGRALSFLSNAQNSIAKLPPIHFDFVNGAGVNAFATRFNGEYCIAINSGVILVLSLLYGHAFADRKFLPHVGDLDQEAPNPPRLSFLVADALEMIQAGALPVLPLGEVRMGYFRHFVETAFDFLVSHEFAHIANGHVDYLAANQGLPCLAEFGGDGVSDSVKLTRQTLEMDADSSAVGDGVGTVLRKISNIASIPAPWDQFYRDPSEALLNWYIAIFSLFRLFGDSHFTSDALKKSWYPPVRMRQFMAGVTAREHVLCKRPDLEESFCAHVGKAVEIVEHLFVRVFSSSLSVGGLQDVLSDDGFKHMDALRNHWSEKVRAEVLPFAYTQLAP
jgi:hypothetical protein